MAVTYTTAAKLARITATKDHFINGTLEIGTAGMAQVLATFTLTASAGSAATDTWTLGFASGSVTAGGTGTAAAAVIKTSGAASDITGLTVGTGSENIVLDSASITTGQTVTLSSASIQHAA